MERKVLKVVVVLMVAGLMTSAQAAWTLVDDFDSYDNSSSTQTDIATGSVWGVEDAGTGNSNVIDYGGGQVLQTIGGTGWSGAERDLTGTGAAIAVGETQTYFWQVNASYTADGGGWDYDLMMGLAPEVSNIDSVDAWSDFSVMPFINNEAVSPFINADAPTSPWWAPMTPDTWTNVWVVINNDAVDPTFDLYYSTGTDAAVLVASDANWRNHAVNLDLNAIGFMAAGNAGTEFMVDNIYYADGVDLTNPVPEPATMALLGFGALAMLRKRK